MQLKKVTRYETEDGVDIEFRAVRRKWFEVYVNGLQLGHTRSQSMVRAMFFYRKYLSLRKRFQAPGAVPVEYSHAPQIH